MFAAASNTNSFLNQHSQNYMLQLQPKYDATSFKLQNVS